jgi:hypothetical protein
LRFVIASTHNSRVQLKLLWIFNPFKTHN